MVRMRNGQDAGAVVQASLVELQGVQPGVNTMLDGVGGGVFD